MQILTRSKFALALITGVLMMAAVGGLILHERSKNTLIPASVQEQISYGVYLPEDSDIRIQPDSVEFEPQSKGISYVMQAAKTGDKYTVSQQATPEEFTDIPEYLPKLIERMGNYATIDTVLGKVYLTKKQEADSKQIAVMNEKGTLVFVQADRDLTNNEWRALFKNFQLEK